MATGTSGVLGQTANMAELGSLAAIATNQGEGNRWQLLNDDEVSAMAAGSVFSLTTLLAGGAVDGETTFVASWERGDGEKIDLTLTTPDGRVVTSANAEALGIEYARDDGEEYAEYTVPASFSGRAGRWVSTVSAAAATGSVSQQVETESSLSARIALHVVTPDDPRPPMVSVTVANPLAVKGATVTVDVYDEDGNLVQAGIPLNDRAVPPDASANDGIYSASLAGIIRRTGSYEADAIRSSEPLKAGVRLLLLPLVGFGYLCITIGFLPGLGILFVSVVALYRGIMRRFAHTRIT